MDARAVADIYRHGGGNPFYLEQLARASEEGRPLAAAGANGDSETGVPAAVAASLAEELESLPRPRAALLDGAAVAGEPFEPDLAAAVGRALRQAEGLDALDDLLARGPRARDPGAAALRVPPPAGAPGGLRVHARRLAARGARRAPPRRSPRAAPPPASAPTTSSSRRRRATRRRSRCWWRPARRPPAARAGRGGALVRGGAAAAARRPTASARWSCGWRWPRRCARSAPSSAAARRCWRRSTCSPRTPVARRVELTTLCAAVEHWQGRHEDAHQRLVRAWEELPDRDTTAAAALQIELAVDGLYELDFDQTLEMGAAALETARALGDRPLIAAAASALALGEACGGRDRGGARAPRRGARADRPAVRRRAGAAARGALLPRLGRELPRALRRGHRARRPRHRDRARHRRGPAARPDDAREGLPARDAGAAGRGARGLRGGRGVRPPVRQPALPLLGAVRARLGPLLPRATSTPASTACEESARVGGRMAGGTMPAGERRPGLAARVDALRARRLRPRRSR